MKKTLFLVIFTLFCIGNISALHVVEESPEFPGGMKELLKYMKENVQYPEEAIEKGIEGRVWCQFTVKTDGSIDNIVVLKSIHKSLDEEAIRVIKNMPKWKPGKNYKGEVQDCKYTIPFPFKLPK
jgi:protein TonB